MDASGSKRSDNPLMRGENPPKERYLKKDHYDCHTNPAEGCRLLLRFIPVGTVDGQNPVHQPVLR
jgi:hypothetical protein